MTKVVIGITTCQRPIMLERALRSLETLETDAEVEVLVADNDAEKQEGIKIVNQLESSGYRFKLNRIVVHEAGIPFARNAIVENAFADSSVDFLAFMDDDQWVEPQWLTALLAMQQVTDADVVAASVIAEFFIQPHQWVIGCNVYERKRDTQGTVDIVYGTGGILLSKHLLSLLDLPWFDPAFALTGGSDAELFHRFRLQGARFARAAEARIHETYPASRLTLRWALQRAYRIGGADLRIIRKHHPGLRPLLVELVKIVGVFAIAPILLLLNLGRSGRQVDALCKIARAGGKIAALFGSQYREYATIHGH